MHVNKNLVEPDFTVPEVARILRVAPVKIRRWIRSGELTATNISNSQSRPCYTITREALAEFRHKRTGRAQSNERPVVKEWV